jgi:hypothetical protein
MNHIKMEQIFFPYNIYVPIYFNESAIYLMATERSKFTFSVLISLVSMTSLLIPACVILHAGAAALLLLSVEAL